MATQKNASAQADAPVLNLNGKEYVISELPQEAQQQLLNVRIAESEINRLKRELAIAETAYNAYRRSLVAAIPSKD